MATTTYTFHISAADAVGVVQHSNSQAYVSKELADHLSLADLIDELGLTDLNNRLVAGEDILLKNFLAEKDRVVTLSKASLNFALDKLFAGAMTSHLALRLAPLIRRMKSARAGEYKLPADLSPELEKLSSGEQAGSIPVA